MLSPSRFLRVCPSLSCRTELEWRDQAGQEKARCPSCREDRDAWLVWDSEKDRLAGEGEIWPDWLDERQEWEEGVGSGERNQGLVRILEALEAYES